MEHYFLRLKIEVALEVIQIDFFRSLLICRIGSV